MIEKKNAKAVNEEGTIVDLEINHPMYGWINYTYDSQRKDTSYDTEVKNYLALSDTVIMPFVVPTPATFEEIQASMITKLHTAYDAQFDAYLAQYPKGEQTSFEDKATEAKAYHADNTVETPIISAMVGGDETLRVEMLEAVWAKIIGIAQMEGQMIAKRDVIKACTTIKDLEAL